MADWRFLALAFVVLGFELDVLALTNYSFANSEAVVATQICGFLAFLIAFLLLVLVRYGELQGSKVALVIATIFAFAAAALIIIGLILYRNKGRQALPPYHTTLLVCGAAFGLLSGIFSVIDICKN